MSIRTPKRMSILKKMMLDLIQLQDIGILSNPELEEIIEVYQRKHDKRQENEQYQKYAMILGEPKEIP